MKDGASLSRLLRESAPDCPLPRDFQAGVWRKIAEEQERSERSWLKSWTDGLGRRFLQPRFSFALAVAVVAASLVLGQIQASAASRRAWSALETRYAASIDPYSHHSSLHQR